MEPILQWLSDETHRASLFSAGILVLSGVGYALIRKRVRSAELNESARIFRLRLAGLGVAVLAALVLTRTWFHLGTVSGSPGAVQKRLLWTVLAALASYIVAGGMQRALMGSIESIDLRHKIRRSSSWVGVLLFFVLAALIWADSIGDVSVFLGIFGAGVALSLQETLLCIAGWVLLILRKPFDIGDRVEIGGQIGDVIDVGIFQTSMLEVGNWVDADQSTGRMLLLPNSMLFRHPAFNYTKGFPFIWSEFPVIVTFESDWKAAKAIMLEQARDEAEKMEAEVSRQIKSMQGSYAIHYERLQPIVYTGIAEVGVRLTLRYLSPVRQRRTMEHRVAENILESFIGHPEIDFAYPTTRIFRNTEEGKPGLGGPAPGASRPVATDRPLG